MKDELFIYYCKCLFQVYGIPVRILKDGKLQLKYELVPMNAYLEPLISEMLPARLWENTDDFKVLLGYDLFRHNTTFGINMAVGTDNSTVEFQKLILNDPENFGKSKKKEKEKPVEEKKESDPMNRSVKDYDDYNPGYGILNNLIQPGIRPSGY